LEVRKPVSVGEVVAVTASAERWPSELIDCYQVNAPMLTGYLVTLVGDTALAQDLTQEAFVRMFARWRHVEHPRAYVYLTAVNLARHHWRRSRFEAVANQSVERLTEQSAPASDPWLRDLVERLPKRLRTPVLLHYYADLPIEQVRDVMHLPLGTVKRRLYEARQLLREHLEASDA
jgi:RNA polymerase sigma-70 factor (ECF subfamily)